MSESFLRRHEVCARIGLSKTTLYTAIRAGDFPRPVRIAARAKAWPESEVTAWIAARIASRERARDSAGGKPR